MDNAEGGNFDWLPVLVTALIVGTTSLTADFATKTWTEIQTEIDLIKSDEDPLVEGGGGGEGGEIDEKAALARAALKNNKGTFFTLLGIAESDLPKFIQEVNRDVTEATDRLKMVIGDEWDSLTTAEESSVEAEAEEATPALSASSLLFASDAKRSSSSSSITDNVQRILNGKAALSSSSSFSSSSVEVFDFEKEAPGPSNIKKYTVESILFTFVLFGAFLEYSN